MKKIINIKHFIRLYKMNRIWGDNILEAAYYSLRGKAFVAQFGSRTRDDAQQININDL